MVALTPAAVSEWPAGVAAFGAQEADEILAAACLRAEQWRDAQELARDVAMRATLARTRRVLAHDVRSPLGVVLGHAQLIQESLVDGDARVASGQVLARQVGRLTAYFDAAVDDVEEALGGGLGRAAVPVRESLSDALRACWGDDDPVREMPSLPRVWDRGGAWGALVDCIVDPALGPWSQAGVAVGLGRIALSVVYRAPSAVVARGACARHVRVLGGDVTGSGQRVRIEVPGDDGRLAVAMDPDGASAHAIVDGLRALGARVTLDPDCADVVLALGGNTVPTCLPVLALGRPARRYPDGVVSAPRPCVPASATTEQVFRLLRVMAEQPPSIDPMTGASLRPPRGEAVRTQVTVESGERDARVLAVAELVRCAGRATDVCSVVTSATGVDVWADNHEAVRALVARTERCLDGSGRHTRMRVAI